ncbi:hypothetical protein HPG84_23405 (plasmid) [Salmonella enterica]|nr:hypothetical protein HPG84_23405 [Salmonella enterica]
MFPFSLLIDEPNWSSCGAELRKFNFLLFFAGCQGTYAALAAAVPATPLSLASVAGR